MFSEMKSSTNAMKTSFLRGTLSSCARDQSSAVTYLHAQVRVLWLSIVGADQDIYQSHAFPVFPNVSNIVYLSTYFSLTIASMILLPFQSKQ